MAYEFAPADSAALRRRIKLLEPDYPALAARVSAASQTGAWIDHSSGALLCGHRPHAGPSTFALTLSEAVPQKAMLRFNQRTHFAMPASLRNFYRHANGGFVDELSIFGISDAIDRGVRAPLATEMGEIWRTAFAPCDGNATLFCIKNVSEAGQIGFFVLPNGSVVGRGNGEALAPPECGHWASPDLWFCDQLTWRS